MTINSTTYRVEAPKLKDGLKVTLTVFNVEGEPVHSDRVNLDRAREREKFADAAGIDTIDLLTVRETLLDARMGAPADAPVEEHLDAETTERAKVLLTAPDFLDQVAVTVKALGYASNADVDHLPRLVYLALVSRLLQRPLNLVVTGPSSVGKSYLVTTVARLFIWYISDFDPAGDSMPVSVVRQIEYYRDDYAPRARIKLTPLALRRDQVVSYRLPRTPIKESDLRRYGFEERYGEGAVELDALEALFPGELATMLREAAVPYVDFSLRARRDDAWWNA
jgi:hypothetical protein